jgi:Xaa-Pro dipeptidase
VSAVGAVSTVDARVARLRERAAAAGLDAVLATSDASIAYLTGFWGMQLERLFAVVVRADGGGAIIGPSLDREGIDAAPTGLEQVFYEPTSNGLPELRQVLTGTGRVGVEEHHLNFGRSSALTEAGLALEPAAALVMRLRERKSADEVERLRAACAVVEQVLQRMWEQLRPGDEERTVNARVDYWLRELGATASHPLVLFGEHAADPHGTPGARRLAAGDVICADVSAQIDGYWGDLTRCGTVGEPSDWARRAHAVVREAHAAAVAETRPGVEARAVDAAQRRIVEAAGDVGQSLHGAGHAIGTEIHEPPFLVPTATATLVEGMVFTIEPGIYRSGVGGIRLEDDVLVGADGPVVLSTLPLELSVVATGE